MSQTTYVGAKIGGTGSIVAHSGNGNGNEISKIVSIIAPFIKLLESCKSDYQKEILAILAQIVQTPQSRKKGLLRHKLESIFQRGAIMEIKTDLSECNDLRAITMSSDEDIEKVFAIIRKYNIPHDSANGKVVVVPADVESHFKDTGCKVEKASWAHDLSRGDFNEAWGDFVSRVKNKQEIS